MTDGTTRANFKRRQKAVLKLLRRLQRVTVDAGCTSWDKGETHWDGGEAVWDPPVDGFSPDLMAKLGRLAYQVTPLAEECSEAVPPKPERAGAPAGPRTSCFMASWFTTS